MGKVVNGIMLIELFHENKLEQKTKIRNCRTGEIYWYDKKFFTFWRENSGNHLPVSQFMTDDFEILSEEETEIDIDNLTEMNLLSEPNIWEKINIITQNINELIKAVKQLNKKLEEK